MKRFFSTLVRLAVVISTLGGTMPKADITKSEQVLARTLDDFCEHHKKMLEDIDCPLDELHVYDLLCWDCKREQKR